MTTDRPELYDVIQTALAGALGAMRVIGIGTVDGYDPTTQSASVTSALKFCYWDEEEEELVQYTPAAISNIPVLHPSAGGFFSAMPVKAGDQGVILTADRALDSWKATGGGENETRDGRRFNFVDSLFLPCGVSLAGPLKGTDTGNEYWVWGEDTPTGFKFKLGKGKFEFGTPLVSFLDQLTNALTNASKTATFAGSSVVTTLLGPMPLSNAGQLASQAIQLAQVQALISSIKGTL
jgi:hypothetical protein